MAGWAGGFLLLASAAQGATYYVSTAGNDSNAGTQAAPFLHVSKGALTAQAGDTVIVMNGTYGNEGQVANPDTVGAVVTMANSGTASAPITIMAQNRGQAILDASSTVQSSLGCYGAWSYFDLSYVSYVVIQGFVIQNGCINGIRANGTAHDLTIRWNVIQDIGNWSNPGATLSATGMYLNSSEYNITFDGNTFTNIGGGSIVNQEHALYVSASNVTVVNNVFYNNVHGWDIQAAGAKNLTIADNTFAFPNPSRAGHIILWDDDIADSLQNIVIEDNVFYEPQSYAVVAELDAGGSIGGCSMVTNLTTVGSMFDNGATFGSGGVSCSQSGNLTSTNPDFVNASSTPYNFALQAGSPAIDSGTNNSYTAVDFNGASRPAGSNDIGAYQYGAASSGGSGSPATIQVSANPGSVSMLQGGAATSSIAVTVTGSADPTFTLSGVPSGVTASLSPSSCTGSCTVVLSLGASSTYQGTAQIGVTATNGSVSGSTTIAVSVTPPPAAPPSSPAPGDYTSGLAAEWKLVGNTTDAVAGDNGTLHGGSQWITASIYTPVRVLHLNGTNAYMSAPEKSQLEMTSQMTVAAWVYATQSSDQAQRIVAKVYDWDIKLNGTHPQLTAGNDYAMMNYSLPLNAWTHIAFAFSSGTVTAYVNGQPVGLAANTFASGYSLPTNQYGMYIGTDSSLSYFFSGYLSDVRLYNRALAAGDVSALYAAGTSAIK